MNIKPTQQELINLIYAFESASCAREIASGNDPADTLKLKHEYNIACREMKQAIAALYSTDE